MNIHEPFSRCDCGEAYVYEKKQMLIAKDAKRTLTHEIDTGLSAIVDMKSTLHCSKCDKLRYHVDYDTQ